MKRAHILLIAALLVSLFIYLFYRTDRTVINTLFNFIFGIENYQSLKASIRFYLPLHEFVVYSLPEGLWVFCITVTSKDLYLKLARSEVHCAIFPLTFVVALELMQWLHLTNGTFDVVDILTAILFWMLGFFIIEEDRPKQNPLKQLNKRSLIFLMSYLIVYLAHVYK
ncbi:MAG: hypothetical protein REI78_12470 [Pedobacter sp.]|nr:hypothetical protein [Pedobacter sp.]MDQ8053839.1 hypothetical protein [Pedobacter sp.]